MNTSLKSALSAALVFSGCLAVQPVMGAGEVLNVQTRLVPATPYQYAAEGQSHTWGAGNNQIIESFSTNLGTHRFAATANRVTLMRDDIGSVATGVPCGVFVERTGATADSLAADFPNDAQGSGNCDMAAMLTSRVVNRGTLDVFANAGPTPKNIERVDYLFDAGVNAPFSVSGLAHSGHLVAEKRGNNRIQVAAILSLNAFGQPATFGPLVRVHEFFETDESLIRYGETNLRHNYSFFQSNSVTPQAFPVYLQDTTETVAMAYISAKDLGLSVAQRYYGFSYFGDDVDPAIHSLTDVATFPDTTADHHIVVGDGADIYGGVSGLFFSDSISIGSGAVFLDEDDDNQYDATEAGISGVVVSLFEDTDADGQLTVNQDSYLAEAVTNEDGRFWLPGLPNGSYLLSVNSADPNLPAGTEVPADENPLSFTINSDDPDNLNFAVTGQSPTLPVNPGGADGNDGNGNGGSADGDGDGSGDGSGDGGSPPNDGGVDGGNGASSATDAVADVVRIEQGETTVIDVLANDIDGPGVGLTIVSVDSTPNAMVSIENGQISFTPDFAFYGTAAFFYTLEDGDGTQDSASVSVDVLRASDINNNGINDFIECDCISLQLETGVHGIGAGGALNWLWLVLLGFLSLGGRVFERLRILANGASSR